MAQEFLELLVSDRFTSSDPLPEEADEAELRRGMSVAWVV